VSSTWRSPVGTALKLKVVEPVCAALCAQHADHEQIADRLDAHTDLAASRIADGEAFTLAGRAFHDELVRSCGIETLALVLGTLESLWSELEAHWAGEHMRAGNYPTARQCEMSIAAHRAIAKAIRRGSHGAAEKAARVHLEETQCALLGDTADKPIAAVPVARGARPVDLD